jgi:hypothetical protein
MKRKYEINEQHHAKYRKLDTIDKLIELPSELILYVLSWVEFTLMNRTTAAQQLYGRFQQDSQVYLLYKCFRFETMRKLIASSISMLSLQRIPIIVSLYSFEYSSLLSLLSTIQRCKYISFNVESTEPACNGRLKPEPVNQCSTLVHNLKLNGCVRKSINWNFPELRTLELVKYNMEVNNVNMPKLTSAIINDSYQSYCVILRCPSLKILKCTLHGLLTHNQLIIMQNLQIVSLDVQNAIFEMINWQTLLLGRDSKIRELTLHGIQRLNFEDIDQNTTLQSLVVNGYGDNFEIMNSQVIPFNRSLYLLKIHITSLNIIGMDHLLHYVSQRIQPL